MEHPSYDSWECGTVRCGVHASHNKTKNNNILTSCLWGPRSVRLFMFVLFTSCTKSGAVERLHNMWIQTIEFCNAWFRSKPLKRTFFSRSQFTHGKIWTLLSNSRSVTSRYLFTNSTLNPMLQLIKHILTTESLDVYPGGPTQTILQKNVHLKPIAATRTAR